MPLDPDQQDELRFALRRYLAARSTAAVGLDMIRHAMRLKGMKATDDEIEAELLYWTQTAPPQVQVIYPEHSSAKNWQITNAGRLADQRNE